MLEGIFIDKRALVAWVRWRLAVSGEVTASEILKYVREMPYYAVVFHEEVPVVLPGPDEGLS